MNPQAEITVARQAIAVIAARFPHIQMIEERDAPVELSVRLPVQPGLSHEVWLALQNNNELHFSVGHFWLEWFPCTNPSQVSAYISAVSGFVSGNSRVLEHFLGKRCTKAELQIKATEGWETIGTWKTLLGLLPLRGSSREIINTSSQPMTPNPSFQRTA